jgi:predicted nucleic acid-binding protein
VNAFFDTNVIVYAQQIGAKANQARRLLADGGALSVQVLNEFVSVARRKLGKDWNEVEAAIEDVLALVDAPRPLTLATNKAARALARDHGFAFYDALIVAAALEAGCDTLYSEDMQHGSVVAGLTIVDPFRAGQSRTSELSEP